MHMIMLSTDELTKGMATTDVTESTHTTIDHKTPDTTADHKSLKSKDALMEKSPTDAIMDKSPTDVTSERSPKSTGTVTDKLPKSTDTVTDHNSPKSTNTTANKKTSSEDQKAPPNKGIIQDPAFVEMSASKISSLLVSLRPYFISQSDLSCCTSPTGSTIPTSNITGAFGTNATVKWFSTDCSLQEFNLDFSGENKAKYGQYLSMCAALSKLRHPNIQQLLGFVSQEEDDTKPSTSIVAELVDLTLTKLLADCTPDDLQASIHISIAYDVTKGVSYLHSSKMLHLLIRSDCVLVTRGYLAKLCDIPDSQLYQYGIMAQSEPVNVNYLPPDKTHSTACDTFSIGVLTLQIITHATPSPVPINDEFLTEIQRRQSQIDLVHSSHPLLTLILNCLANKPDDRPADKEICSILETALKSQD